MTPDLIYFTLGAAAAAFILWQFMGDHPPFILIVWVAIMAMAAGELTAQLYWVLQ